MQLEILGGLNKFDGELAHASGGTDDCNFDGHASRLQKLIKMSFGDVTHGDDGTVTPNQVGG